jgi:hypothetical protein
MRRAVTEKYRWGRAVATMAGIAVALLALVVVTNRISQSKAPGRAVGTTAAVRGISSAPFIGPVALGDAVTVTGDPGFKAQLEVVRGTFFPTAQWTLPS